MSDTTWRPGDPDRALPTEELRDRASVGDLGLLAAVPGLLLVAHLSAGEPNEALVLSRADPTPVAAVATHFVHRTGGHLLSNLLAYALVVPTAYAVSVVAGQRRRFLLAFLALLVGVPPLLSAFDLLAFDRGVVLGFSGVTMAYVGLLAVSLGTYVEARTEASGGRYAGPALFSVGLAVVALRVGAGTPAIRVAVAVVALAAAALLLRELVGGGWRTARLAGSARTGETEFAAVAVAVFGVGLLMGFPGGSSGGGVVVNTYGHFLGYALGFLGPYAATGAGRRATGGSTDGGV